MTTQTSEIVRYRLSAFCVLAFLAAQTFQVLAFAFWIPVAKGSRAELLTYSLPIDQARSLMVMGSIVLLVIPYITIALRYYRSAPVLSLLGLVFGVAFIGFEVSARSIEFFVVGQTWARELKTAAGIREDEVLDQYALWNSLVHAWYFPLLLSHLIASCAFAAAAFQDAAVASRIAVIAFALNALRLVGRLLGTFAGQAWLSGLNDRFYYPAVLIINALLVLWFWLLSRSPHSADAQAVLEPPLA